MTPTHAPQSPGQERPGVRDGMQTELTLIAKVKPGHAAALRETLARLEQSEMSAYRKEGMQEIGTLHNVRWALLDDDTRFLFATVFDGPWDAYIDDFATSPRLSALFDDVGQHLEGYPGISDPTIKDWFVAHQVPVQTFSTAYPDLTVQQIWKLQRAYDALQGVLDSPDFQAAVKDPASAKLLSTPAFQKLLNEVAG
jgi:hypothetical protein